MGQAGMMGGGGMNPGMTPPPAGSKENPVGRPPSVVSGEGGEDTMPAPDPYVSKRPPQTGGGGSKSCTSCGADLRPNAKFCTKCGTKA